MTRLLGGVVLACVCVAAVYGYTATRRERLYREHIGRGEAALAADETSAAIEAFSGAIALKSDSMLGYLKRGEAYRRRHDFESALRDLRRASDLDPAAPRAMELLGDVNYALGRFQRAAERYQAYVAVDDRASRVFYKLGLSRYRDGHVAAAVAALRRSVALDDRLAEAYYLLGLCYRDLQKPADSLAALRRSVSLAPALLHAREELADLFAREGRTDEHLAQLEALLALDPGPSRDVALGLALARAGRSDTAVMTLSRAVERHPNHPQTYLALGRVWLDKAQARGDRVELSKAVGALEKAVASERTSEALTLYGRSLILAGNYERARQALLQATAEMPVDPVAFYFLADVAERLGDGAVARRALLDYRALEGQDLDPRRSVARQLRLR